MLASLHVNIACVAEISALQVYRGEREREIRINQPVFTLSIIEKLCIYILLLLHVIETRKHRNFN